MRTCTFNEDRTAVIVSDIGLFWLDPEAKAPTLVPLPYLHSDEEAEGFKLAEEFLRSVEWAEKNEMSHPEDEVAAMRGPVEGPPPLPSPVVKLSDHPDITIDWNGGKTLGKLVNEARWATGLPWEDRRRVKVRVDIDLTPPMTVRAWADLFRGFYFSGIRELVEVTCAQESVMKIHDEVAKESPEPPIVHGLEAPLPVDPFGGEPQPGLAEYLSGVDSEAVQALGKPATVSQRPSSRLKHAPWLDKAPPPGDAVAAARTAVDTEAAIAEVRGPVETVNAEISVAVETVDHPAHYGGEDNPYEAIKVIRAWGLDFSLGNAVKYLCRAGKKGSALEDLKKARWYLDEAIRWLEKAK